MALGVGEHRDALGMIHLEKLGEDGVEVELLHEGSPAPYPDLLEDVGEMVLYRVL